MNLMTIEGALSFCEWCKAQMREEFLRDGEYPSPDGYVLATCAVPAAPPALGQKITAGKKLPEPIPIRVPFRGGHPATALLGELKGVDEGEVFAKAMKFLAEGTAAVGTVLMMEMWYISNEGIATPTEGRWFDGEVRHQPDRREALCISLEHKAAGTRYWQADILRDPLRLDPWIERPVERTEGRLTHLAGHES